MPLGLHPDCKRRLAKALTEAVPYLEVKNGMFLERNLAWVALYSIDDVLPERGKIRESLVEYIDEHPFAEFVMDSLSKELSEREYNPKESLKKLLEIEQYKDAEELAVRLVEEFDSLPQEYCLTLRLPESLQEMVGPEIFIIELSPTIRIVRATSEFKEKFSLETDSKKRSGLTGLASLMMDMAYPEWVDDALYLQIETTGYIDLYGGSNTHLNTVRVLRSFCGLGLALQLFETRNEYTPEKPTYSCIVHRNDSGATWKAEEKLNLSDHLTAGLNTLRLSTGNDWVSSQERQQIWSDKIFDEMRAVFREERKAERILLSSQWFFDGSHGPDELLQYIRSMVVIEIVLGDKKVSDQIGLNELLRNRCAYLIGNSQEERDEVHKVFKDIYDVRSAIVHSGKHRLTLKERELLHRLRWMCRRVLQKEVDLLKANKTKSEE